MLQTLTHEEQSKRIAVCERRRAQRILHDGGFALLERNIEVRFGVFEVIEVTRGRIGIWSAVITKNSGIDASVRGRSSRGRWNCPNPFVLISYSKPHLCSANVQ